MTVFIFFFFFNLDSCLNLLHSTFFFFPPTYNTHGGLATQTLFHPHVLVLSLPQARICPAGGPGLTQPIGKQCGTVHVGLEEEEAVEQVARRAG
jgi:hypothetical protein